VKVKLFKPNNFVYAQKRIDAPQPQDLQTPKRNPAPPSAGLEFLPSTTTGTSYWTARHYKQAGIVLALTPKPDQLIIKDFYTHEQLARIEELTDSNYKRLIKAFDFPEVPKQLLEKLPETTSVCSQIPTPKITYLLELLE